VLLAPPTAERLRGLANLCARSLGITVLLLAASAVIDVAWALQSNQDWHACSAQALGTLLVLPCCAALLYARLAQWIQPFGLMAIAVLVFPLIPLGWQLALAARKGSIANFSTLAPILTLALLNLSLTIHAALRYYFGRSSV
jgi:hypothetical protein